MASSEIENDVVSLMPWAAMTDGADGAAESLAFVGETTSKGRVQVIDVKCLPSTILGWLAPDPSEPLGDDGDTVAYTRNSSAEQTAVSQPRQKLNIGCYAERIKQPVKRFYCDCGFSGTSASDRPEFQAMLRASRSRKHKRIIVENIDRFSRNLHQLIEAFQELDDLGIELHDTNHGRLNLAQVVIFGFMAQEGRKRFLELAKGGKRNAIRDGKVLSIPPYGYRRHPGGKGRVIIVFERMEILRRIFQDVVDGIALSAIAARLNADCVPTPDQCLAIDKLESTAGRNACWNSRIIRRIIRQAAYMGLNIWGRYADAKKTNGSRNRLDIVATMVEDLVIVNPYLWSKANRVLEERAIGTRPQARSGIYLLKNVKYGSSDRKARIKLANGRPVYHSKEVNGTCSPGADVKLRVAWVEKAIFATLARDLFDLDDAEGFAQDLRLACERAHVARMAEMKPLVADLKGIDDWCRQSLDDSIASGLTTARTATYRKEKEAEAAKLRAKLERLQEQDRSASQPGSLRTLKDGLAAMALKAPFQPTDDHGSRLFAIFRELVVGDIVLTPPGASGIATVSFKTNRFALVGQLADSVSELRTHTCGIDVAAELAREAQARLHVAEPTPDATIANDLSDAAWRLVAPLLADANLVVEKEPFDGRALLNGVLFTIAKDVSGPKRSWPRIPARYGDADRFWYALTRMVRAGCWDAIVAALGKKMPGVLDGLALERMDSFERGRGRQAAPNLAKGPPKIGAAEEARQARAHAKASKIPNERRRFMVAAMYLEGVKPAQIRASIGLDENQCARIIFLLRRYGLNKLFFASQAKGGRKNHFLTPQQKEEILTAARSGCDPRDPSRKFTIKVGREICAGWGVPYTHYGFSDMLMREDVRVTNFHKKKAPAADHAEPLAAALAFAA